jgi:hypothetical protein
MLAALRHQVHLFLQVAQQLGHLLDLVEDGAVAVLGQKAAGIAAGVLLAVERLQRHLGQVGEGHARAVLWLNPASPPRPERFSSWATRVAGGCYSVG